MSKKLYEQPTTKTFVVRFEGVLCNSPRSVSSPLFIENGEVDDSHSLENWWN